MSKPLFSIVIPTYNRADFISKTINSLLAQTYINFEIIVVDDGSIDNTEEVVSKIKDERLFYFKKENAERGAARNFGAKKAKGDYINFFDSDDLAYPNHLQTACDLIIKEKHPPLFALHYDIKNTEDQIIRTGTTFKYINQQIIDGNLLSCNGVFIKKEITLLHPFSEIRELSASEDYLLWLQLSAKYPFSYSNTKTSIIIEHDARSVLTINKDGLINRKLLMLRMALDDMNIAATYKTKLNRLKTNTYSYLSLHLMMNNYKKEALSYLLKAIQSNLLFIGSKRFLVILKYYFI